MEKDRCAALFNIYLDKLILEWKINANPDVIINLSTSINNIIFADDHVIIQESYYNFPRAMQGLKTMCPLYDLRTSIGKIKATSFEWNNPAEIK